MATPPSGLESPAEATRRFSGPQVAALALVVLLIVFLLWFFLLRSDDTPEEAAAPAAPVPAASPEPEANSDDEQQGAGRGSPVETFEVFAPKDPFDPLISASAGGGTTDGTGTTTDGTGTTTDGTGTTTPDGTGTTTDGTGTTTTTTSTGSGTGSGGGGGQNVDGHRVRVIDVYQEGGSERAQVQVDGTVYTVDEGERFAENFQLMSTSGRCATMLYGDDEFTLCEGEEILK